MAESMAEIVAGVKKYAYDHYEEGWDVIVECYEYDELVEEIGNCKSAKGAIRKLGEGVRIRKAYGDDIRGA